MEQNIDADNDSASDYTIFVKHIPHTTCNEKEDGGIEVEEQIKGDCQEITQKIIDYFEKKTRELLPEEEIVGKIVNRVNLVYDIDDLVEFNRIWAEILEKYKGMSKDGDEDRENCPKRTEVEKEIIKQH